MTDKEFKTIDEQLEILRSRGLTNRQTAGLVGPAAPDITKASANLTTDAP